MKVVFFAGGVGTRLWPVSRKNSPKQFEKIIGDKSTLQLGIERILPISSPEEIYVSTGDAYKEIIYSQLPEIPRENIILEPEARDVGAAVGLVSAIFAKISPNEPFVILWSDHLVKEVDNFQKVLLTAENILKKDPNKIIFLGQHSRFASENLGWIERGEEVDSVDGVNVYEFKSLLYRPDSTNANKFHLSERHTWNPGYFLSTGHHLFSLYKKFVPEMAMELEKIANAYGTDEFSKVLDEIYPSLEKISFDNLILEKLGEGDGYVISDDLGWSDIGAWEALKEALSEKQSDNVTKGKILLEDTEDSIIYNYTDKMVVGIDLEDMIVVNTDDVVMVCPKSSVPKIKKLVESLKGTEHENLT